MRNLLSTTFGIILLAAGAAHGQEDRDLPPPVLTKAPALTATANEKLAQAIAERLRANAKLKRYHVEVEVNDGVVELTGRVADTKQRDEVVNAIKTVPGVARIRDNLMTAAVANALATNKSAVRSAATSPIAASKSVPAQADESVMPAIGDKTQEATAPVQAVVAPTQSAPDAAAPTQPLEIAPLQAAPAPIQLTPIQTPQADLAPVQIVPPPVSMAPLQVMQPQMMQPQYGQPQMMQPQFVQPQMMQPQMMQPQMMQPQFVWAPVQPAIQPGMAPRAGMPPEPLPIFTAQPGMPNPHLQPPPMPPNAWPTFAPYNNVSRVAYPNNYPYEAWPFIGPMYPFPKVPLGWRNVSLGWRDGYWWYGREASGHDWWRIRYW